MPSRNSSIWDVRKEFGHLMLPFPKVWIEWNNMRESEQLPHLWMGAMCVHVSESAQLMRQLYQIPDSHLFRNLRDNSWTIVPFSTHAGKVMMAPSMLIVDLDQNGVLEGVRGVDLLSESDSVGQTAELVDLLWDSLVAVGWLNCRNVRTERRDRSGQVGGSKSNRRKACARGLDFHTIHLPGIDRESDNPSASTPSNADFRMHHVRGHFKTFTPEAPLMGKHVGTYWWGWQVRGNKNNGVVVSDYRIGEPA